MADSPKNNYTFNIDYITKECIRGNQRNMIFDWARKAQEIEPSQSEHIQRFSRSFSQDPNEELVANDLMAFFEQLLRLMKNDYSKNLFLASSLEVVTREPHDNG